MSFLYEPCEVLSKNSYLSDLKPIFVGSSDPNGYFLKRHFKATKVIFHKPATIVYWIDGSKTVVKCSKNDIFDPEKGLAMCFMKRAFEIEKNQKDTSKFHQFLKEHVNRFYETKAIVESVTINVSSPLLDSVSKLFDNLTRMNSR